MAVIKGDNSEQAIKDAIVLDLADLSRHAERIVSDARGNADRVIEEGRREARRIMEEARREGRRRGYEEGVAQGRAEGETEARQRTREEFQPRLEQLIEAWSATLDQWETERRTMLLQAQQDVLVFAFELGRKIVNRLLEADPSIVTDQLAAALDLLTRPSAVEIDIHPDDRPLVEDVLPRLTGRISGCQHATLCDRDSISRGGCVIRTAAGRIDATIESQLECIAEALLSAGATVAPEHPPETANDPGPPCP